MAIFNTNETMLTDNKTNFYYQWFTSSDNKKSVLAKFPSDFSSLSPSSRPLYPVSDQPLVFKIVLGGVVCIQIIVIVIINLIYI